MAREHLIKTLGKVIIAAAWADGMVSTEEINSLKDLLFRLPKLTALQWAELEIYIETPIPHGERERLIADLQAAIISPEDKRLALETLNELIAADGVVTDEERQIAEQIAAAVQAVDANIFNQIGKVVRGPVRRRSDALHNREAYLEDFINNKVYYGLRRKLDSGEGQLDIPDGRLRKLSLAGGLMAHVIHNDRKVTDDERAAVVAALQADYQLAHDEAEFVAEIVVAEQSRNMDYMRTAREFVELSTADELRAFLRVLFTIAAADGMATQDEIIEIRNISRVLKLEHQDFIDAKLTVPRDKRAD